MSDDIHPSFEDNIQVTFLSKPGIETIMTINAFNFNKNGDIAKHYDRYWFIGGEKTNLISSTQHFIPKEIIPELIKCLTEIYEGEGKCS
jgi:hypothetical protein